MKAKWEGWRKELPLLNDMKVKRCLKPTGFEQPESLELHHFSDASSFGYGQCSYVRIQGDKDVHCAFVIGKSRVAPLKSVTIPQLELTAAVVYVKVSTLVNQQLEYVKIKNVFWTDSKFVLGYINNEARRCHVFAANQAQPIR